MKAINIMENTIENKTVNFYVIKDPDNSEVVYVGKTIRPLEKRLRKHLIDGKGKIGEYIKNLHKAGKTAVIEKIDECCESDDWESKERQWISLYKEKCPGLLNMTPGGMGGGGYERSPEYREKISDNNSIKIYAFHTKTGIISEYKSATSFAKLNAITQSAVFKALKNGGKRKGYLFSYSKDFKQTERSKTYKTPIICTSPDGSEIQYQSSNNAAVILNLDAAFIRKVCRGEYSQYKGYKFRYGNITRD